MSRRAGLAAAALAALMPAAPADEEPAWRPAERRAPIIATTTVEEAGPLAGCLVLLEGESDAQGRELAAVCPTASGTELRELGAAPDHAASVAAVRSGGVTRLWIGVPGGVDAMGVSDDGALAPPVEVLRDARLHPDALVDRPDLDGDGLTDLVQAAYDGLAAYRQRADGALEPLGATAVAPVAVLGGGFVAIRGTLFRPASPSGPRRWGNPRSVPGRRLALTSVPVAADGPGAPCEALVTTDAPRDALVFDVAGGPAPRLVALTARTDRTNILGEYELLVATLACDPTRRGRAAEAVTKTPFPVGGSPRLSLLDVTGDGLEDAVVVGRAGRLRGKAAAAVVVRRADGTFEPRVRDWSERTELAGGRLVDWSRDLTGDGPPDLVYGREDGLVVVPGGAAGRRGMPLELRDSVTVPWPPRVEPWSVVGYVLRVDGAAATALPVLAAGRESEDDADEPAPLLLVPDWSRLPER